MTRPKGIPNKPKVEMSTGYKDDVYPEISGAPPEQAQYAKYLILQEKDPAIFMARVNNFCMNLGWECQGGVSITSWHDGLNGIQFMHCQAMVRND